MHVTDDRLSHTRYSIIRSYYYRKTSGGGTFPAWHPSVTSKLG
jgi:hypothetical protein